MLGGIIKDYPNVKTRYVQIKEVFTYIEDSAHTPPTIFLTVIFPGEFMEAYTRFCPDLVFLGF